MYWGRDWDYFPKAAPRPKPKPGKRRKKFGATWWGRKWVDILSDYEYDQRMSRGRSYARADMVKKFEIGENSISAKVKGSSGDYSVTITFDKFKKKDWKNISNKLKSVPLLMGKLLNNEMPEEIGDATGYCFIPDSFEAECSCPDYANPCKHIAAVFYTVADEIDHDPMIIFKLRGMEKDKLLRMLELSDDITETKEDAKKEKRKVKKKKKKKKKKKGNKLPVQRKKKAIKRKRKTKKSGKPKK
ncbi:MAG: SWIM zinc finger family protein [Nanoarchaeota archaeon]|nr:SWIM zinc finger family protein [Nanoarchaeota archaeon]